MVPISWLRNYAACCNPTQHWLLWKGFLPCSYNNQYCWNKCYCNLGQWWPECGRGQHNGSMRSIIHIRVYIVYPVERCIVCVAPHSPLKAHHFGTGIVSTAFHVALSVEGGTIADGTPVHRWHFCSALHIFHDHACMVMLVMLAKCLAI